MTNQAKPKILYKCTKPKVQDHKYQTIHIKQNQRKPNNQQINPN